MKNSCFREAAGSRTVFLIGAGRSGTTLLYKLLCLHPKAAFISNYDNRIKWLPPGLVARLASRWPDARLKAWFNTSGNAYVINRPLIKKLFPMPVEGDNVYRSCGVPSFPEPGYSPDAAICACLASRFEHIRRAVSADIMISKRTANNRRLQTLEAIFPGARYIHLIRDGRDVANSLSKVGWWDDHVLWWDGRTARQMEVDGKDRLEICARNWVREMKELYSGLAAVDSDRLLEVRYEQLLSDPVGQLGLIMEFLGIELTSEYQQMVESLNLALRPGNWQKLWTEEQLVKVLHEQRPYLDKLGYLQG